MTNEDLTRLKIDRSSTAVAHARKRRIPLAAWLTIAVMLVVLGILYFRSGMAVEVESSTVTTAYPSQSFTLLNATGYVVAQRKAAVASKATGRVERNYCATGEYRRQCNDGPGSCQHQRS